MTDRTVLRDIADAWHLCVLAGLANPNAAATTEAIAAFLAVTALLHGHPRAAITLTATTAASITVAALLH
ncbi:hypothetical protein AB0H77_21830 [Streptomyces sp. NPDC050844]|uniref:hypothetical protein n=1 Tax=Streptomyces sp. NPDC050844 TaxID=3155790 RepID=UPI0033E7810C